MNIFRLAADMLHLLSFIVMLYRMKTQRSCRGVSLKSQILFLTVFCCLFAFRCNFFAVFILVLHAAAW